MNAKIAELDADFLGVSEYVVKGFEVGDVFLDDADCKLSDHRIIGCTLKIMTK